MAATAQTAVAAPSRTATPSDYLRMPFTLPSGSLPVGLLACQRDPLLRSLETRIVRAHKAPTSAFALTSKWKSKGGKNKANDTNSEPGDAPAKTAGELWEVQLQDTTLFPEGGGQPSDTGFLILLDPQGSSSPLVLRVESAIRCNLDAVHFVRVPTSAEPSRIPDSLVEGSRVRVEVDWDRRRDHMEMHTGQHLLSALLEHRHNLPTLGWALTTFPQPSYVELPRAPTAEEIEAVSRDAEELIAAGTRVNVDVRREEALGERPESMPDDYGKEGVIRTVEISGVDRNPCCGTHWPSLSFLRSLFILPNTSSVRGTNVRLYFLVGGRVSQHLRTTHLSNLGVSRALECSFDDTAARTSQLVEREKATRKRETRLRDEVVRSIAAEMAELLLLQPSASSEEEQSRKTIRARKEATDPPAVVRFPNARFSLVQWHREEAELEMLVNLSRELSSIVEAYPGSGSGTVTATTTLVALSCGPVAPSQPSAGSCALLTFFIKGHAEGAESAGDADNVGNAAVSRAGHKVKELFGSRLRGGGKGRWQGKLADGRWQKEDAQMVAEILEKSVEQV